MTIQARGYLLPL
ncbi:unnamed protein product [Acanthoscelides obtectus]|uniref:Uncharacterized protein n=1 Tax=Acanthoscelides obtectus TaxID=200917 RepID=A0A9P0KKL1_ACAOB|nr:unnamed protein product [Acanthoscelides obtectus]CAK1667673.1 hypothetical protein AOBTE_LOCUS25979 [Acanthoscelides obtectus]